MTCGRSAFIILFIGMTMLLISACSGDDDDSCDSNDDCLSGWGWVCVNHKCVQSDGDQDSESAAEGDEEGIKPCSQIEDEEECLEDSVRCMWEDDACSVRPYTPDGDYDYDYQDGDPGENGEGCRYLDYEQCSLWPQCEWTLDSCRASGIEPGDCSIYRTESECARGYGCKWNGYACVEIM